MPWTKPAGVTPIDRKPPSSPTYADTPAVLDWLREFYGGHTVIGLLITDRATGTTYRVDGEPSFGTPGTLDTYRLTPFGDAAAAQAAQQAQSDAKAALDAFRPITDSDGMLVLSRLDGTARLLYGPRIVATPSTYTLRGKTLKTLMLTEAPA